MNKTLITATVAGIVLLASNAQAQTVPEGYQLQQVLMMSRHNLRAPLANNGSVLEQSTPNKWPEWDVPGGQLTTKGGVLEVYMGHYMREWLALVDAAFYDLREDVKTLFGVDLQSDNKIQGVGSPMSWSFLFF